MPFNSTEQVEQCLLDQVKPVDEQDEHAENRKNPARGWRRPASWK